MATIQCIVLRPGNSHPFLQNLNTGRYCAEYPDAKVMTKSTALAWAKAHGAEVHTVDGYARGDAPLASFVPARLEAPRPAAPVMRGLTVTLSHAGNPDLEDLGGYWTDDGRESGKPAHVLVNSLAQAQQAVLAYIERNGLGGGNWTGGALRLDGVQIGHISYNGRAWPGVEWRSGMRELQPSDPVLGPYARGA